jgi:hypothetical protein
MLLQLLTPPTRPRPTITWDTVIIGGLAPVVTYATSTINPGQRFRKATKAQVEATNKDAQYAASKYVYRRIMLL